jgi:hypothetical protein
VAMAIAIITAISVPMMYGILSSAAFASVVLVAACGAAPTIDQFVRMKRSKIRIPRRWRESCTCLPQAESKRTRSGPSSRL